MTRAAATGAAVTNVLARLAGPPVVHTVHAVQIPTAGDERDSAIAIALARLEIATAAQDEAAAARILDGLTQQPTGGWLLRQMAAAGLRALAGVVTDTTPSTSTSTSPAVPTDPADTTVSATVTATAPAGAWAPPLPRSSPERRELTAP